MINFKPITLEDKSIYQHYLSDGKERGCEFSFTNLYSWGHQSAALLHDHIVLLSNFYHHYFYPHPIGSGDQKPVLDAIIADAAKRGIPCRITGLNEKDKQTLETLYPGMFCFSFDRDSFDYVYAIDDLADLKGRKYHRKRNHFKRFQNAYPEYRVEPLNDANLSRTEQMIDAWYENRLLENPEEDYQLERAALHTALRDYKELALEGLLLIKNEEILAVTLGSPMSSDTFDVHFEKARWDVEGAYTAINCEFARYIRDKYPEIKYLNREEDMGIPGLRKAKESYFPHHQIEKYRAYPIQEDLHIGAPHESQLSALRALWQEAFGDSDEFLDTFHTTAFSPDRCRCITIGGKVTAVLYWFDCEYESKRVAYLYAIATARAFRGQGLCHRLMENTHAYLSSLGYEGTALVPACKELFEFYEKQGYRTCSYVREFTAKNNTDLNITESETAFSLQPISKEEFAILRTKLLPEGSVIQENENLDFLETQAKFYAGEDFVMAAYVENECLHCVELLGNASHARKIMNFLGCTKGHFRTPGDEIPFAMYHSLTDNEVLPPKYFSLAFD